MCIIMPTLRRTTQKMLTNLLNRIESRKEKHVALLAGSWKVTAGDRLMAKTGFIVVWNVLF